MAYPAIRGSILMGFLLKGYVKWIQMNTGNPGSIRYSYLSTFITCTKLFKIKLVVKSSNPSINIVIPPTNMTE